MTTSTQAHQTTIERDGRQVHAACECGWNGPRHPYGPIPAEGRWHAEREAAMHVANAR